MHRQRNEVFHAAAELKGLTEEDVLKFVVSSKTDLEDMKEIIMKYFPGRSEVLCESRVGENRAA